MTGPLEDSLPGVSTGDVLVLADVGSEAERRLVVDALDGDVPGAGGHRTTVLPLRGDALAGPLDGADPDTVVTAVRVAWKPRSPAEQRSGHRGRRFRSAARVRSLVNPTPRSTLPVTVSWSGRSGTRA